MTKWKQRRREREAQRQAFALVAERVFLEVYVDKTYNLKMSKAEAIESREAMCEAAWNMADFMMEAKLTGVNK